MTPRYNRFMTVETTLQQMFDGYPDLFSTREECFNHLFCTIGNGYRWKWGQLVCTGDDDRDANEHDYLNPAVVKAEQSEENIAKKQKEDKELHDLRRENDLEDGLPDIGEYKYSNHWYPLSKRYSALFEVPSDAKPDWKAAVEECKKMLEKDGIDWRNAKDI